MKKYGMYAWEFVYCFGFSNFSEIEHKGAGNAETVLVSSDVNNYRHITQGFGADWTGVVSASISLTLTILLEH